MPAKAEFWFTTQYVVRRTAWAAAAAAADEQRTLSAEIINRARVQFLPSSIMPIFDTFSPAAAAANAVAVVDLPIFHRFGVDRAAAAAHVLIFPHSLAKALHDGSEGVSQLSSYRLTM